MTISMNNDSYKTRSFTIVTMNDNLQLNFRNDILGYFMLYRYQISNQDKYPLIIACCEVLFTYRRTYLNWKQIPQINTTIEGACMHPMQMLLF